MTSLSIYYVQFVLIYSYTYIMQIHVQDRGEEHDAVSLSIYSSLSSYDFTLEIMGFFKYIFFI